MENNQYRINTDKYMKLHYTMYMYITYLLLLIQYHNNQFAVLIDTLHSLPVISPRLASPDCTNISDSMDISVADIKNY